MSCFKAYSVLSVSAAVLLSACGGPNPTVISGTLLGHDGEPMVTGGVRVSRWSTRDESDSTDPGAVFQVADDGSFEIETFETGLLAVRFVGAYHENHDVLLYADTAVNVGVDVKLGTSEHSEEFERLSVVGSFNDYDIDGTLDMERQLDGRFTAEIETNDSIVSYLVMEFRPGAGVELFHGTDSTELKYGDWGSYESVVRPAEGRVSIVFDPSKLSHTERESEVTFREPESIVARLTTNLERIGDRFRTFQDAKENSDDEPFTYDWSDDIAALEDELAAEQNPLLRQALLLDMLRIQSNDGAVRPEIIELGLREIHPLSHIWSFKPDLMLTAVEYLSRPASALADSFSDERLLAAIDSSEHANSTEAPAALLNRVLTEHPDPGVRADLLVWLVWTAADVGDTVRQQVYYERLATEHPDYPSLGYLRTVFSPDRNIAAGKMIPDFSVASLEDSAVFHTRQDLMGSAYLIDFWATWCAPCIAELPNVHEAYHKYKDRGFQVLSVAVGDNRAAIADFRRDELPMPWLHAFHGWDDDAVAAFEVNAIPRAILVGADGVILASDVDCQGERLHETLERVLGEGGND